VFVKTNIRGGASAEYGGGAHSDLRRLYIMVWLYHHHHILFSSTT